MENEKYVGQCGPDRKRRVFNPKSLSNLKQFQKPVSEANLSVNLGTNWIQVGLFATKFANFTIIQTVNLTQIKLDTMRCKIIEA